MKKIQAAFTKVIQDNRLLLIQEGGRAHGAWCLPGGHVDQNETTEEAALREAREESGLNLQIDRLVQKLVMPGQIYLGPPDEDDQHIEVFIFECTIIGGKLQKGIEELAADWFTKAEVEKLSLRWAWIPELFDQQTPYLR